MDEGAFPTARITMAVWFAHRMRAEQRENKETEVPCDKALRRRVG